MKPFKILIVPILLLIVIFALENNANTLTTGDIAFSSFDATGNDSFSIITLKPIQPNTTLFFTDAKWTGNRFRINGNHLTWNSGSTLLKAGSLIEFKNIKQNATVNVGEVNSKMALSKKGDAIYAYRGLLKMPDVFLAGISNDIANYGTLNNTGLEEGESTITFPIGTYYVNYQPKLKHFNTKNYLKGLKKIENYNVKTMNYNSLNRLVNIN